MKMSQQISHDVNSSFWLDTATLRICDFQRETELVGERINAGDRHGRLQTLAQFRVNLSLWGDWNLKRYIILQTMPRSLYCFAVSVSFVTAWAQCSLHGFSSSSSSSLLFLLLPPPPSSSYPPPLLFLLFLLPSTSSSSSSSSSFFFFRLSCSFI